MIRIFKTFGFHSRKLLRWKNIDQLCIKDHVAFVEEKLGKGLWVIHVPLVSPLTLRWAKISFKVTVTFWAE